jgi:hypothetical protein
MKFTNKELSDKLKINLAKVRRWSREFLPPDHKATMRSGYARELTEEEAYEVFLGGHLVSVLRFQVHEAKGIIEDLRAWIKSKGLYPGKAYAEARRDNPYFFHVHIMRNSEGEGLYYEMRQQLKKKPHKGDRTVTVEEYRAEVMAREGALADWRNVRILGLTELLLEFSVKMVGDKIEKIAPTGVANVRKLIELANLES